MQTQSVGGRVAVLNSPTCFWLFLGTISVSLAAYRDVVFLGLISSVILGSAVAVASASERVQVFSGGRDKCKSSS